MDRGASRKSKWSKQGLMVHFESLQSFQMKVARAKIWAAFRSEPLIFPNGTPRAKLRVLGDPVQDFLRLESLESREFRVAGEPSWQP
jgi:hypothetical protein